MKKQVLSVEQMQELRKLGFDITVGSMIWVYIIQDRYKLMINEDDDEIDYVNVPTFTLQDIVSLLPEEIEVKDAAYNLYELVIDKYSVKYCSSGKDIHEFKYILHYESDENLLYSAYNMLIWLIKSNKL